MKQSLSFKNGVTNNPSDLVCEDNCLRAAIGTEFKDGAHIPIQVPEEIADNFNDDIVIIHDFADYTHIIATKEREGTVYLEWYNLGDTSELHPPVMEISSEVKGAQAIGNTVVLSTKDGLLYLLWKNDTEGYKPLGGQLPEIEVTFNNITHRQEYYVPSGDADTENDYYKKVSDYVNLSWEDTPEDLHYPVITSFKEEQNFKNVAIGLIEKCVAKAHRENLFLFPYWARAAYRLYDGSHAMITNPVLVLPTVRYNRGLLLYAIGFMEYEPFAGELWVRIDNDLSDWGDIILGVDIFVSNEVRTFDVEGTYSTHTMAESASFVIADMVNPGTNPKRASDPPLYTQYIEQYYSVVAPEQKSDQTIINDLIASSVFYLVSELETQDFGKWLNLSGKMAKYTVQNLTTQTQLEHDDFFGHCKVVADTMLAYNGRLHLAGLTRGFFGGFQNFITLRPSVRSVDYYVEIQSQSGTRIIHGQVEDDALAYWFYYPDPRAKHVYFLIGGSKHKLALKQHPFLNGAYYFGSLPSANSDSLPAAEQDSTAPTLDDEPEVLPNQIITSEVNNPFVYNADGANDVGSGRIQGLVTNTQALSEGQFGQHPLIAFTDEGIWALTPNSEGIYSTIVPLSREVCSNPDSITQTDDSVFFATAKGLMILVGRKAQSVSELLEGKDNDLYPFQQDGETLPSTPLREILQKGKIAYDYKAQRLWMYRGSNIWTFNIKSRTFSQIITEDPFKTHSRLYPDCIIQTQNGKLLSMMQTPDINDDPKTYDATIITRPVKLNDTFAYKTITRIGHLWLGQGNVTMDIWGSDNLTNWQHLNSLHGMPWKYYTFRLDFTAMKATDTYHGMLLEYNVRHTNRLHTESEDSQNQDNEQGTHTTP